MANIDYAGLLTGISGQNQQIDPFSLPTAAQQRMAFGAQQAQGMQRAGEGLFGMPSQQNPVDMAKTELVKLDRNDPEYQQKFIKLLGIADPAKAAELQQQAQNQDKEIKQTNALLKIARAQGNNAMVTWLEAQGDINTAASVLLKQPKLATPEAYTTMYDESGGPIRTAVIGGKLHKATETGWELIRDNEKLSAEKPKEEPEKPTPKVSLTPKEREKIYDAIISTNPDIAKVFTEGGWWDSVDKDAKTLLLNKAEELYAANPKLGREGALLQAAEVAPTTTGQPVPRADSFVGKTIK